MRQDAFSCGTLAALIFPRGPCFLRAGICCHLVDSDVTSSKISKEGMDGMDVSNMEIVTCLKRMHTQRRGYFCFKKPSFFCKTSFAFPADVSSLPRSSAMMMFHLVRSQGEENLL